MASYDVADVKSVQRFLVDMKTSFDKVNVKLEESDRIDYDEFSEAFYKANEGILKNRDALKKEKLDLNGKLEQYTNSISELEKKVSSIDVELPGKYNQAIEELSALKDAMKDGGVDIDVVKSNHQKEVAKLTAQFDEQTKEKLGQKDVELTSTKNMASAFQELYFDTLKRDSLVKDLDRIKVNPEDRPLIMKAYLGRAEIAGDGDGYNVAYKTEKGDVLSGKEFWDKWASDEHNQKYILADTNVGGGASGLKKPTAVSKRDHLVKELQTATDLKQRITLLEKLGNLDN